MEGNVEKLRDTVELSKEFGKQEKDEVEGAGHQHHLLLSHGRGLFQIIFMWVIHKEKFSLKKNKKNCEQ